MFKLHMLCENYSERMLIYGEFGLSMYLEIDDFTILFDTGLSGIFSHNADIMGVNPSKANALVVSHGHKDHTGGLARFFEINTTAPVYAHPEAIRYIHAEQPMVTNLFHDRFIAVPEPIEIHKNIYISGPVQQVEPSNAASQLAYADREMDEEFLIVKRSEGIHIILGCSHPGVTNCVLHAKNMFKGEKILSVTGGMHMLQEPMEQVEATIEKMIDLGVTNTMVMHCTGIDAYCAFKRALGDQCRYLASGSIHAFE